ncbi:MAG: hypothetical protein RIR94_1806 [Bacteroidota bacterium]|jgi:hypothetical protein
MNALLKSIYAQKKHFVCKHAGEELLLIPLKDNVADFNQYLVLNELGAYVWEALDSSITIDLLQEKILTAFEVTPEQLNTDLEKFLPALHHYTCP